MPLLKVKLRAKHFLKGKVKGNASGRLIEGKKVMPLVDFSKARR